MRFRPRVSHQALHKPATTLAAKAEVALIEWWSGLTMKQRRAEWLSKTPTEQRAIHDVFGERASGEVAAKTSALK